MQNKRELKKKNIELRNAKAMENRQHHPRLNLRPKPKQYLQCNKTNNQVNSITTV
ncbi:hypothetical protein HanHA300_Chr12g0449651 [Helianthus annuus]|nr:hypothetical protein HanHA300_Chr12g0449651 [Helianthus annuus]KAJ0505848.1 hypothetical protein HanHA89_Chr12g0475141 [Helianthus annuus]KAJ0675522.1 hypothetical protein HanLR1_Chr12g0452111 [Helianthus annuus]KAJ0678808.1 hypothetical protein HanOQP8_Chr12g0452071 [Helianthus annuus]